MDLPAQGIRPDPVADAIAAVLRGRAIALGADGVRALAAGLAPRAGTDHGPAASLARRRERERDDLARLASLGIAGPAAHAVRAAVGAALPHRGGEDAGFLLAGQPGLAAEDRSPARIAALPGLLNLVRRVQAAAAATPFWAERASWDAIGRVEPEAVALLRPMLADAAHGWWVPALGLAERHCTTRRSRYAPGPEAGYALVEAGLDAVGRALARATPETVARGVSRLVATAGVAVVEAAAARGMLPAAAEPGASEAYVAPADEPWRPPAGADLGRLGRRGWTHFSLADAWTWNPWIGYGDGDDEAYAWRAFPPGEPDAVASLGLGAGRRAGLDAALRAPGARLFVVSDADGAGYRPRAAAALVLRPDPRGRRLGLAIGGPYCVRGGRIDGRALAYAALVGALDENADEWGKLVPPGEGVLLEIEPISARDRDFAGAFARTLRTHTEGRLSRAEPFRFDVVMARPGDEPPRLRPWDPGETGVEATSALAALRRAAFLCDGNLPLAAVAGRSGCRILYGGSYRPGILDRGRATLVGRGVRALGRGAGLAEPAALVGGRGTPFLVEASAIDAIEAIGLMPGSAVVPCPGGRLPEAAEAELRAMFEPGA